MFGFIRNWKRSKLKQRPLPPEWEAICTEHLPFYRDLDDAEREIFHENLKIFVWEKIFIGAKGLEVTDEHRVVIAAAAVRLIQHLDISYYDRLTEIVVYPYDYTHKDTHGVILGEAHHWGIVVLSWPSVLSGLHNPCDGLDTASHEFAHVLDRDAGAFDGTPILRKGSSYRTWADVMSRHYESLQEGATRERKVMRDYGATNEAEFFAVATEAFFEKSDEMRRLTPDLYEELRRFYGVDPVSNCDQQD
jgi:MtfA peptidase